MNNNFSELEAQIRTPVEIARDDRSLELPAIRTGVSVLIVCYNEIHNIEPLLQTLSTQSWSGCIREVLVADNGSRDGTYERLLGLKKSYEIPLTLWQREENNMGAARQQLVDLAQSNWVVFIDADCLAPHNWLKELIQKAESCLESDAFFVGCGGGHYAPEVHKIQKAINALMKHTPLHGFSAQSYDGKDVGRVVDHLPTTNAIFNKHALKKVGGFSSRYNRVGEDLDLGLKLTRHGFRLYRFAKPSLQNDCASSLTQWAQRMFRFGTAQGLVFGRRRGFLFFFLVSCLAWASVSLMFAPLGPLAFLILIVLSCAFANRVSQKAGKDLWRPAFLVTVLTPPSYFLGFVNGLVRKLSFPGF